MGPLRFPSGRDPRRPWALSPFSRLARAHAASVSGDALFAIGLAGSVFFSLDFNSARWRVALYLVLTIAPFAVAAPLIGPAIDRIKGGRRWIIVGSLASRAILCALVVRHMGTVWFYPEAFGMLVLQKVYSISKSAVVPGTVTSDEELVEANSKLTVLSALAVVVAAVPGGILLKVGGGGWSVGLGAIVFGVGTVLALRLTPTTVAAQPADEAEKQELRSAGILLASSAMSLMRGVVGFLSFMLAFAIKENGALWELGLVAVFAQFGFFCGAVAAPRVRKLATEERILLAALIITAAGGVVTAVVGGLLGAAVLSMLVGATGSAAKQAFDAIVQRDAPDANRGRSFARFETRFQLVWVIGALIPIVIPIPPSVGFAMIAVASLVAVVSYIIGLRRIGRGEIPVRRDWRRRPVPGAGAEAPDRPSAGTDAGHPTVPTDADPTLVGPTPVPPASAEPTSAERQRRPEGPLAEPPIDSADPTLVTPTASGERPAPDIATVTTADHTVVADSPDPARRWMRSAPKRASETRPPSGPDHRRQGLLFEPEAWDPVVPTADDADPDGRSDR